MTAAEDALRFRLAHLLVVRRIDHGAYRRLVDLLDAGATVREVEAALVVEVERELADEVERTGREQ